MGSFCRCRRTGSRITGVFARKAGKIWVEYGALEYFECVADDVKPGQLTSFPQSVMLKDDETVIFAWIV